MLIFEKIKVNLKSRNPNLLIIIAEEARIMIGHPTASVLIR